MIRPSPYPLTRSPEFMLMKDFEPFKFNVNANLMVNRHFAWRVIAWASGADVYCKLRHVSISKDSWFFDPL